MESTTPDTKIKVGIFFGGKSAEHEISLQSAQNVIEALDKDKFEPVLIFIDKEGIWHLEGSEAALSLVPGSGQLVSSDGKSYTINVAFPVLHGPLGEDGSIQGLFELANLPYVGPGILGSAVGMDKDIMKRLLRDAGIPIAAFQTYSNQEIDADKVFAELGSPVFVKPANMGSSVGVSRAKDADELKKAVADAFQFDTKIIIEEAIVGDEIECSIMGNEIVEASILGRIIPRENDFYSYDAKYIDDDGAVLEIPANLSDEVSIKARQIAIQTFLALDCQGMSRVDMFATKNGDVIVNEINTIPGFTKISMYPKLWEASGVSYTQLITKLIELSVERHTRRSQLKTSH